MDELSQNPQFAEAVERAEIEFGQRTTDLQFGLLAEAEASPDPLFRLQVAKFFENRAYKKEIIEQNWARIRADEKNIDRFNQNVERLFVLPDEVKELEAAEARGEVPPPPQRIVIPKPLGAAEADEPDDFITDPVDENEGM